MATRYRNDPRWLEARFPGICAGCKRTIRKGAQMFYYPTGKHTYCEGDDCGGRASRDFAMHAADEDGY